jgi:hypothetical protein
MSMRDFMTRVLSAPVARAPATPVAPIAPAPPITVPLHIVAGTDLDPPTAREDESSSFFYWDIETRSAAVLGKAKDSVGVPAYAEHPTTEVLCVSFARDNSLIETWIPGQPIPEIVVAAAADPGCSWIAHNAAFERAILEGILRPRHGWPMVPVERHVCTMSLALAHAYPGSLEDVAELIGLVNQKDTAREKIVRVMWKPRKPRRGEDPGEIYWIDSAELRDDLYAYNRTDVAVSASCISIRRCGLCRPRSRIPGRSMPPSMIGASASTRRWPRRRLGLPRLRSLNSMSACGTRPAAR